MYSLASVCVSVCKQDISITNVWIFAEFAADIPYILSWKPITFGADHSKEWLTFGRFSYNHVVAI